MVENTFFFSYTNKLGIVRHRSHANLAMVSVIYRKPRPKLCLREICFIWVCTALATIPCFLLQSSHWAGRGKLRSNISPIIVYFTGRCVIPCTRLKFQLAAHREALVFSSKLVVPCICVNPCISDKGLRCDWTIQQKDIQNQFK